MKMRMIQATLVLLVAVLSTAGTALAQGQNAVRSERRVIQGFVEPNTPGAPGVQVDQKLQQAITDPGAFDSGSLNLNKSIYVRFYRPGRAVTPKAIVILIPDEDAGSGSFRLMANEIVRLSQGRFEVWAIDRRSNLLEDLRPMVKAENDKSVDASVEAFRAYMSDPAGRGGFIANNPKLLSGFMSEWGLDVHLRDIKAVVEQARKATPNVFMGGHAFGAAMTQMFAAYSFGDTEGYKLLKGMILIEGSADPKTVEAVIPGVSAPISDEIYLNGNKQLAGLNQLRAGTTPPFIAGNFSRAVMYQMIQIAAQITLLEPGGTTLQKIMPPLARIPATNAAAIGLFLDDDFQEMPIARVSMGFLEPPPGLSFKDAVSRVKDDPTGANPTGLWSPKRLESGQLFRWVDGSSVSRLAPELKPEVSTVDSAMRQCLMINAGNNMKTSLEDANSEEWYFPSRLRTDISRYIDLGSSSSSQGIASAQRERGGNPVDLSKNRLVNLNMMAIRASNGGFISSDDVFYRYARSTAAARKMGVFVMNDYAHSDVLTSLAKTSRSGKNVPELIVDFVRKGS